MSKPKSNHKHADPYKRGYANGVIAAVDALLDDLHAQGEMDDVHYADHGDGTMRADTCTGCLLAAKGYPHLSDRWSFAAGHVEAPPP